MTSRLLRVASLSRCQSVYPTVKQSLYNMDLGFGVISVSGQLEHETHFYQLYMKVSSWVEAKKKNNQKTNLNLKKVIKSEYFLIPLMDHIKIKKKWCVSEMLIDDFIYWLSGSEIVRCHV